MRAEEFILITVFGIQTTEETLAFMKAQRSLNNPSKKRRKDRRTN